MSEPDIASKITAAAQSPAGQELIAEAGKIAGAALDAATLTTITTICAKHGLPVDSTLLAVHAIASHFGISSASDLLARLAPSK